MVRATEYRWIDRLPAGLGNKIVAIIMMSIVAVLLMLGVAGQAKAQIFLVWRQPVGGPVLVPPQFMPPQFVPPQFIPPQFAPRPFMPAFDGTVPVPGIPGGINVYGRDAWGVAAPVLGAGTTAVLQPYVGPAAAGWAGDRVAANAQSAYREQGPVNQAVRTFAGVSVRDIQDRGILGGDCSFLRNPLGNGC
jgi:hypothetical protein